jgi:segregation and condensation protein B
MEDLKYIVESLLFVAKDPITLENLKKAIPDIEAKEIRAALLELSKEYEVRKGGFYLKEVAGGYQLRTRPEYSEWISRLLQPNPMRLSKAALETLAIIAYKQPVIRSDVEHIRGVDSGSIIRMLLDKKLIRVLGRKDIPGRPLIYATTKHFLEVFDLKDLRDLPTPKEIEELGSMFSEDSQETAQTPGEPESQKQENPDQSNVDPTDKNQPDNNPGQEELADNAQNPNNLLITDHPNQNQPDINPLIIESADEDQENHNQPNIYPISRDSK